MPQNGPMKPNMNGMVNNQMRNMGVNNNFVPINSIKKEESQVSTEPYFAGLVSPNPQQRVNTVPKNIQRFQPGIQQNASIPLVRRNQPPLNQQFRPNNGPMNNPNMIPANRAPQIIPGQPIYLNNN